MSEINIDNQPIEKKSRDWETILVVGLSLLGLLVALGLGYLEIPFRNTIF